MPPGIEKGKYPCSLELNISHTVPCIEPWHFAPPMPLLAPCPPIRRSSFVCHKIHLPLLKPLCLPQIQKNRGWGMIMVNLVLQSRPNGLQCPTPFPSPPKPPWRSFRRPTPLRSRHPVSLPHRARRGDRQSSPTLF